MKLMRFAKVMLLFLFLLGAIGFPIVQFARPEAVVADGRSCWSVVADEEGVGRRHGTDELEVVVTENGQLFKYVYDWLEYEQNWHWYRYMWDRGCRGTLDQSHPEWHVCDIMPFQDSAIFSHYDSWDISDHGSYPDVIDGHEVMVEYWLDSVGEETIVVRYSISGWEEYCYTLVPSPPPWGLIEFHFGIPGSTLIAESTNHHNPSIWPVQCKVLGEDGLPAGTVDENGNCLASTYSWSADEGPKWTDLYWGSFGGMVVPFTYSLPDGQVYVINVVQRNNYISYVELSHSYNTESDALELTSVFQTWILVNHSDDTGWPDSLGLHYTTFSLGGYRIQ